MRSPFHVEWIEDSTALVLGRIAADNAGGTATGKPGEGNWVQQADLTSLTYEIFDLDGDTPTVALSSGTCTISDVILDTPVTTSVLWTIDTIGYNFKHRLAATSFPTGGRRYSLLYYGVQSNADADKFFGEYLGKSRPIRGR